MRMLQRTLWASFDSPEIEIVRVGWGDEIFLSIVPNHLAHFYKLLNEVIKYGWVENGEKPDLAGFN